MALSNVVNRPIRLVRSLGSARALHNARTELERREVHMARANLSITQERHGFCGVSLQILQLALDEDRLCAWSVNRVVDLMYAGLPSEQTRQGISDLMATSDPLEREAILLELARTDKVDTCRLFDTAFTAPAYLVHPAVLH